MTHAGRFLVVSAALFCAACGGAELPLETFAASKRESNVERPACLERDVLKRAYFGDLHVHTALSTDAWIYDVRVGPEDAYRYAFGGSIMLPPLDADGRATREVQLDRPLDFAAVTDHAEFLGETSLCADPDSEAFESGFCRTTRAAKTPMDLGMQILNPCPSRDEDVCGADLARCGEAAEQVWERIIRAAEEWNDTSAACEHTTFIGYEYSSHRLGSNHHRNVIFRNAIVPRRPVSYLEANREWDLWELLRASCLESGTGCDVLAIPHNSNISNGRMFALDYPGAETPEAQAERARMRIAVEPIVEVMQHKGDSECAPEAPGVLGGVDEACGFEKFAMFGGRYTAEDTCYTGPLADWVPHLGPNCFSPLSYVRYALTEGLAEEARIGVNPFKFGLMASTDTHNGLAGGVEERSWPGHLGVSDDTVAERVGLAVEVFGNTSNGPGGLIGVWAEENSRDSLFEGMRRREVFGTSGPRIEPRFFGGWAFPNDLCEGRDPVAAATAIGVPMGADMPAGTGGAPQFVAMAKRDAGTRAAPGGKLQRIQVVKGWIDAEGRSNQRVFDVAGSADNGATVHPETCRVAGRGHDQLCTLWTDPDFDPSRRAVYYLRVLENPSCRYSAWQCIGLTGDERPAECDDPKLPRVIQERAWTSPIWYTPPARAASPDRTR